MERKDLIIEINKHLFDPIPDELAEQLHSVVVNIVPEVSTEMVEEYAKAVFKNQVEWKFKVFVQTKYKDQYNRELVMPKVVYLILEGYVLWQIIQSDDISAELKAKFSLIVRNYAVIRKGKWDGIVCAKWLIEIFNYYKEYCKKIVVGNISYNDLLKSVIPKRQWAETRMDMADMDVYAQIRCLCASGMRGRQRYFVESSEFKSIRSPFAKVYLLVKKMVEDWNWKYISESPVDKLREALGIDVKRRKQLAKIVAEVTSGVAKNQIVKPSENTSLLLARISDGKAKALDERMFSVLEFGLYLYYELLLENFNS